MSSWNAQINLIKRKENDESHWGFIDLKKVCATLVGCRLVYYVVHFHYKRKAPDPFPTFSLSLLGMIQVNLIMDQQHRGPAFGGGGEGKRL